MQNKDIAKKLIKMAELDQNMRFTKKFDKKIDTENTKSLRLIVKEIGWPTIPKVGAEASYAAWLLIQHADRDTAFQVKCLKLIKATPPGEVFQPNIAYLTDRVLINQNKRQIYGTQFYQNRKREIVPRPIKDVEQLEVRRRQMDLEPFHIYKQKMRGKPQLKVSEKIGKFYKVT